MMKKSGDCRLFPYFHKGVGIFARDLNQYLNGVIDERYFFNKDQCEFLDSEIQGYISVSNREDLVFFERGIFLRHNSEYAPLRSFVPIRFIIDKDFDKFSLYVASVKDIEGYNREGNSFIYTRNLESNGSLINSVRRELRKLSSL